LRKLAPKKMVRPNTGEREKESLYSCMSHDYHVLHCKHWFPLEYQSLAIQSIISRKIPKINKIIIINTKKKIITALWYSG
jgi:hypothetical protein